MFSHDDNFVAAQLTAEARALESNYTVQPNDLLNVKGMMTLPVVTSGISFVINSTHCWTMPQGTGYDEKGRKRYTSNWTIELQGS